MGFLQGHERRHGPIRLDLVDDRVMVGTQVNEVADAIPLLVGHVGVIAGRCRLLTPDVGFLSPKVDNQSDLPASRMLDAIAEVIASDLGDFEFVKTIGTDTELIRIRIGAGAFERAQDIGSPPEEHAIQSNRMSPAGVPMFYGAFDAETAKAETFDPAQHAGKTMSTGSFRALRELRVLDLAELPEIPSVFDTENHYLIHPLRFLHAFAEDLAEPIARDGREHIEYVPTQIVTEYFRRVFQGRGQTRLDGLIYRSARRPGGKAFVLFCENAQCVDPGTTGAAWDKPLLRLDKVVHAPCPARPVGT